MSNDLKVLIVDDEPDIIQILQYQVEALGFQFDSADGGDTAIEKLKSEKFDVVITDIRMGKGDGISLLKAIKKELDYSPTICFMSGFSDVSPSEAKQIGAENLFAKPFDFKQVKETLKALASVS